jgi:hypothetical protein
MCLTDSKSRLGDKVSSVTSYFCRFDFVDAPRPNQTMKFKLSTCSISSACSLSCCKESSDPLSHTK